MTRTMGEKITSISIGTSQPLELLISGEHKSPDFWWFNVRTIIRNFYEAHETPKPPVASMIDDLSEEIENIRDLCEGEKVTPIFYVSDHDARLHRYRHALIKDKFSPPQTKYMFDERVLLKVLQASSLGVVSQGETLEGSDGNTWITTHHPSDLLSRKNFPSLTLIDSHSASVKKPVRWISKLTKNPDYLNLPFNQFTYLLLGDNQLIKGQPIKYKRTIVELAKEKKWRLEVTRSRMRETIGKLEDKEMKETLLKLV